MIIAKQMDIRANIKEFFDMAYNGETILVPRKQNHNVIIMSEEEYNKLNQASRITAYSALLTNRIDTELKIHNKQKLASIRSMKKNWNGNGAPAFSKKLIDKVENLLNKLVIQPEIFPTALGTIQLEYDNSRRDHMEIEIGVSEVAEVFIVKFNGEELTENINVTAEIINERVQSFYG